LYLTANKVNFLQITDGDFTSKNRGIVFLKNIPEGFEEKQMKGYFSQFGNIKRLKLLRSKTVSCYIQYQY